MRWQKEMRSCTYKLNLMAKACAVLPLTYESWSQAHFEQLKKPPESVIAQLGHHQLAGGSANVATGSL